MILLDNNLKDLTQPSLVLTHAQFSKTWSTGSSAPAVSQRPRFLPPSCSEFFNTWIHDDRSIERAWWVTQGDVRGQAEK